MDDKNFPEYFSQLRSADANTRLQAAESIVTTLVSQDHAGTAHLSKDASDDLNYTLKKLIESAATSLVLDWQVGFTLPLAELLRKFEGLSPLDYIETVLGLCDPKKAIKKSEVSRFVLTKQLCLVSLIESGRLKEDKEATKIIIEQMIADFSGHDWAKEGCVKVILRLFNGVSKEGFKWRLGLLTPKLKPFLKVQQKQDASLLLLWLQIDRLSSQHRVERPWPKLIEGLLKKPEELLQVALVDTAECHPHTHGVLKELVTYQSLHCDIDEFTAFWRSFESYLSETKATIRILHVLLAFLKKTLHNQSLDFQRLLVVCQPHAINLLVRNLRSSNKEMRSASTKAENYLHDAISRLVQDESALPANFVLEILTRLKANSGFPLNRFKSAKLLLQKLPAEEYQQYLTFLRDKLSEQKGLGQWKFYLEEHVATIVFLIDKLQEATIIEETSHILHQYLHSDFDVEGYVSGAAANRDDDDSKGEKDPVKIKEQLREFVHEKLQHLVSAVSKRQSPTFNDKKGSIWKGLCADHHHFCSKFLSKWISLLKNIDDSQETLVVLRRVAKKSKEIQAMIDERIAKDEVHENGNGLTLRKLLAFNSFMLNLCFHHPKYANENKELLLELSPLFDDMVQHYTGGATEQGSRKKVRRDGKAEAKAQPKSTAPKFLNVLVELMISMLTRTESFLRDSIINLFGEFAEEINEEVLGILVSTITRPDQEYVRDMSKQEEDDEEEINGEEDEEGPETAD
eukprot:TRINITY_DN5319_c0_g1_i2.p1 TRINITY_DN5319_c0_g1~~TRINITY_DN5319_c0_g1_i2.p1  ORF type:complete len:742 (-),score=195.30 TRINITY_DN5319_c0_g1_i2:244-2469(-)